MSKLRKILMVLVILAVGVVLTGWGWYRYTFPYGSSHCCSKILGFALLSYAEDHAGRFPAGGDTPEASLSLLYSNYLDAGTLRGKTVPLKVVQQALAKNGKLGPESCGWHYVEGLTEADDLGIAIVWDKVGLGHNGERVRGGGHSVIFLDGFDGFISGEKWPAFLEEQKRLLATRDPQSVKGIPGLVATIRLPTGQVLDHYDGPYELAHTETSKNGSGGGTQSGKQAQLRWYHYIPDGQITLTLTLPNEQQRSKPVSFEVKKGRASPSSIVFEMEKY
jgi:hypothetical protein